MDALVTIATYEDFSSASEHARRIAVRHSVITYIRHRWNGWAVLAPDLVFRKDMRRALSAEDRTECAECKGTGEEISVHGVFNGVMCSYCGGSGHI